MEKSKDKLVAGIGIILIVIVSVFTFARPSFQKNDSQDSSTEKESSDLKDLYPFISVSELEEQIKDKESVAILDSRSSTEFSIEHILGSINVTSEDIDQYLEKADAIDKIVLVGNGSNDLSLKLLAEDLKSKQYEKFSILSGGLDAWIDSGGRTVRQGDPTIFSDQAKINIIGAEDLKKLIDNHDPQLFILDLRLEKAFASGHLPQAKNIPGELLEKKYQNIPNEKKVVFYAGSELETFQLGVTLFDLGFSHAQALEGGIGLWKSKGFPLEK